jgi:hypothetical protein
VKILVCGMTLGQSGQNPVIGYSTLSPLICAMLRGLGHDVDTRIITVGEDLSKYDVLFCGLISPFSVAGKHIYAAVSLLDRYWCTGEKPVVAFADDWTLHQIDQNSRSTRRQLTRLTRPSVFARRPGYDWATTSAGYQAIARVVERATETGWPPLVLPLFGFGNIEVFKPLIMAEAYWPLDPVCYMPRIAYERVWPQERTRQWVLAVIQDHPEYIASVSSAAWPLLQTGGGLTKRDTLVPVEEVVQMYASNWGVLSPPYKRLLGGGWWRERMVHAAMTRSVCLCDPAEVPQLGEPYQKTLHDIESMTTGQLLDLAEEQAAALRNGCWSGDQLHTQVTALLESVTV